MIEIQEFIDRQFAQWGEVADRFAALASIEVKRVGDYNVQFNPLRVASTTAKVDAASITARPCFLCAHNRPPQQIALDWEDMEILVNPFPIFPNHLTIAAKEHTPQSMAGRVEQMRRLSRELPGYTIFYNGAKCGASAPDHMHFQAVPSGYMQIPDRFYTYTLPDGEFNIEEIDPMVNMLCTNGKITVIPRKKHRPDCYAELPVSPAAIDLSGTLIAVNRDVFNQLDENKVAEILNEVTFAEPPVYVGLITNNPVVTPQSDGTTEIEGIVIGKDFHWEQRQTQRFAGEILNLNGQLINRIGVEDYLRSVISSEMSATSSIELLKAHAVISRSWLLAQMRATRSLVDQGEPIDVVTPENETCVWFDRDDHIGYDVCSDDHCQRYQGVTRISTPAVEEAIAATCGLVLTSNNQICDTRFSKCCGGVLERFENCWQPRSYKYLTALADSENSQSFPDLTDENNARQWILQRPAAFCADTPDAVLKQVLNDFDRETTPDFYRWTVRYSSEQLSELIKRRSGIDFGEIKELKPLKRGSSGRIYRLQIVGTKRSQIIGKELLIRRWLSESHLYSSAFVVDRDGSDFVLHGAGWGHGVGLCQIGAAMMAEKGCSYTQILNHYFPDTEISKLY